MNRFAAKDPSDDRFAVYMTTETDGALPNGTVVEKVNSEPGDGHPDGSIGTIVGSMPRTFVPALGRTVVAYFVRWSDHIAPIGTIEYKLKKKG